jgi:hypothetical protein
MIELLKKQKKQKIMKNVEKEGTWIDDNDESIENA